jgi:hypothetical protein
VPCCGEAYRRRSGSPMLISQEVEELRRQIRDFDSAIEKMHLEFNDFRQGKIHRMPDWEKLERFLVGFSRKGIADSALSAQLDRVLYKFQNRKRIWLQWVQDIRGNP